MKNAEGAGRDSPDTARGKRPLAVSPLLSYAGEGLAERVERAVKSRSLHGNLEPRK